LTASPAFAAPTHPRRERLRAPLAAALLVLGAAEAASAQRGDARIEWKDREIAIDYGAVRLGSHSLAELPVGSLWRLGSNNASKIEAEAPIQVGSAFVAPGGYKLGLRRVSEDGFALSVARAGYALGTDHSFVTLEGVFSESAKSANALAIECVGGPAEKSDPSRRFEIRLRYGTYSLVVPAVVHGAVPAPGKPRGFAIDVFSIPADVVAERERAGRPTPIATLSKKAKRGEPAAWNVILGRDGVIVRPAPTAPTASYGFGSIPDDERDAAEDGLERAGTVAWAPAQEKVAVLTPVSAAPADSEDAITLVLACGERTATLTLPDPTKKAKAPPRR
jgi:hypothetical protein